MFFTGIFFGDGSGRLVLFQGGGPVLSLFDFSWVISTSGETETNQELLIKK